MGLGMEIFNFACKVLKALIYVLGLIKLPNWTSTKIANFSQIKPENNEFCHELAYKWKFTILIIKNLNFPY